jgi:predicted transposase YbfD/YdcC
MARPQWLTYFDALPDPRVQRTRRHKLSDILLIVLVGAIRDCRGWDEMRDSIEHGPPELRALFELPHGVPCADTLRRVMRALDRVAFRDAFIAWARALCKSTAGKLVSIDGKTVRGAFAGEDGSGALHLVNAWVSENAMVLGQYATDVKSNEITAIPELLKLLDITGAVVSIDAMGCQKNIASTIRNRGADYVFGLKGNHPTLHREVLEAFDDETCAKLAESAHSFHASADKGHGRNEYRRVWVQRDVDWLYQSDEWPGLKALVLVESERTVRGNSSRERRAYISSVDAPAERMSALVRGHWHVENKLHWVLDVTFGEDRTKIAKKNGAENLALVRKIALNMLQNAPARGKRDSIAAKKKMANWRVDYLLSVLAAGADDQVR